MNTETKDREITFTLVTPSDVETFSFNDENGEECVYEMSYIEEVMDFATSDETCTEKFWEIHAQIIEEYKEDTGKDDWEWLNVINYWDISDIEDAIEYYEDNA